MIFNGHLSHELQRYLISNDGGVSVGNVGKRASMNHHRGLLYCLLVKKIEQILSTCVYVRGMCTELINPTCIIVGMIASFMSTQSAPLTPRSSAVTGSPFLLMPITMRPSCIHKPTQFLINTIEKKNYGCEDHLLSHVSQ